MRLFVLLIVFLSASCCLASNEVPDETVETPQTAAEKASRALSLAAKGEYGRISKVQINMIKEARNRIDQLSQENASFADFDSAEKRIFDHASERINRLTRSTDKGRMVCRRVVKTGTRLSGNECLTVAQREARVKGARERTEQLLRGACNVQSDNQDLICGGGG